MVCEQIIHVWNRPKVRTLVPICTQYSALLSPIHVVQGAWFAGGHFEILAASWWEHLWHQKALVSSLNDHQHPHITIAASSYLIGCKGLSQGRSLAALPWCALWCPKWSVWLGLPHEVSRNGECSYTLSPTSNYLLNIYSRVGSKNSDHIPSDPPLYSQYKLHL